MQRGEEPCVPGKDRRPCQHAAAIAVPTIHSLGHPGDKRRAWPWPLELEFLKPVLCNRSVCFHKCFGSGTAPWRDGREGLRLGRPQVTVSPCVPACPRSRPMSPGPGLQGNAGGAPQGTLPGIAAGNSQKGSGGGELWPQPGPRKRPWLLDGLPTGLAGSPVAAGASVLGRVNCRPGVMWAGCQHAYICWGWQCRWEARVRVCVRVGRVQTQTKSRVTITLGVCAPFSTMANNARERRRRGWPPDPVRSQRSSHSRAEVRAVSPSADSLRRVRARSGRSRTVTALQSGSGCAGPAEERAPLTVFLPSCLNFVIHTR